jgi:Domain of unknown function (DUF4259)
MGAWATGYFGNDCALDWFSEFSSAPNWATVDGALNLNYYDFVEVDDASASIAACAIIAAKLASGSSTASNLGLDESIWSKISSLTLPSPQIRAKALEVIVFLSSESELFELWQEADPTDFQEWKSSLELLTSIIKPN